MKLAELIRKLRFWKAEIVYRLFCKHDENIKNQLKEQIASEYLNKKYVRPYYKSYIKSYSPYEKKIYRHCWIYWKQGFTNAPSIVRVCVESTRQAFLKSGWDVHLIDIEDIKELVDIPSIIWKKHDCGNIGEAHFADYIRVALLNRYGGCWVDATVFMNANEVPEYLYKEGFFTFRNILKNDKYINISNWLIYSHPNNPLLIDMEKLLSSYWHKESVFIQYYGFHILFKFVTDHHKEYWNRLSSYSNVPPHIFQFVSLERFNEHIFSSAIKSSQIHKLTWRLPDDISGTNIEHFLYLANNSKNMRE